MSAPVADRKIAGNDVLMFIDNTGGTSYGLVVCLTSNSFGISNAIIDAKSKCGPDNLPGVQTFEVDFEGQVVYSPSGTKVGTFDLLTLAKNKTKIGWKISTATPAAGDIIVEGTGFIADVKTVYGEEAPATFTAKLGIYGTPTITENPS